VGEGTTLGESVEHGGRDVGEHVGAHTVDADDEDFGGWRYLRRLLT
jgi:hypothetical protein